MNSVKIFTLLSALYLSGCTTTDRVEVTYLEAPKAIKNIQGISKIKINTKVKLSGGSVSPKDSYFIKEDITHRLASKLHEEGFYETIDVICGDSTGPQKLQKLMVNKGYPHGYGTYHTAPCAKCARMEIALIVNFDQKEKMEEEKFTLYRTPYKRTDEDDEVPDSEPDTDQKSKSEKKITYSVHQLSAEGSMNVVFYTKENKKVYERNFDNITQTFKQDVSHIGSLPVSSCLVSQMFMPCLKAIIKDISPHTINQTVNLNPDGNKQAVLLMRANAFTEAIEILDKSMENGKEAAADLENMALCLEVIGDPHFALSLWQQLLEEDKDNLRAKAGVARTEKFIGQQSFLINSRVHRKAAFETDRNQNQ